MPRWISRRRGVAVARVALLVLAFGLCAASDEIRGFQRRLEAYLVLRDRAAQGVPPLRETDSPEKITARERALGEAIRAARPDARPGDVFGAAAASITEAVRSDWRSRAPGDRSALLEELPAAPVPRVNADYPSALPLITFPPNLLARLPELPEDVEYRLYGRHLILRDVKANIVVDLLPDVVPATPAGQSP